MNLVLGERPTSFLLAGNKKASGISMLIFKIFARKDTYPLQW